MFPLATLYVLWIFWAVTAVTALPILDQNATRSSYLEQRAAPLVKQLYLGKQGTGTHHERWCLFFSKKGTGFVTPTPSHAAASSKPVMAVIKPHAHTSWTLIDLNSKIRYSDVGVEALEELYRWIEHSMVSELHLPTTRPDWWPQETPFDSSPQPIREIYYGGPEPDEHDPHAPLRRKRTGGSSLDMVWVILEQLGKRGLYDGNDQGIPKSFQREFNENYIKIWRRRWESLAEGKEAKGWMLKEYPPERYPEWAKLWTEPV